MKRNTRRYLGIILILLAATLLRLHDIASIPPGLTHDEADHGVDAWGVVNGIRPIYFTVGYGREPLYDYSTALLMRFLGPTYLAGRLTSVFFSLLLIAGTYAWVRRAAGHRAAWLTAAGLAVGFWPLMISRHALRTITMPALFVLAVFWFWRGWQPAGQPPGRVHPWRCFLLAGLLLGVTFYTYIPARILWALFPALLPYLALTNRPGLQRAWRGTLLMLAVAGLIAAPLFLYLAANPQAEVRLDQLAGPLVAAAELNFEPLFNNILGGLKTLTFSGDSQWRYNIAGRPFLTPLLGLLFYAGLGVATVQATRPLFRRQQTGTPAGSVYYFILAWLLLGLLPVLITGPELSTTQAAGLLPVLYLFPALALVAAGDWLRRRAPRAARLAPWLAGLLFLGLASSTAQAYFGDWANRPEVRTQYETTLVAAIDYLNHPGRDAIPTTAAISSLTPDRFHDPAIAQLTLTNPAIDVRWFNGQASLLLPQDGDSLLLFTGQSALHPALASYLPDATLLATLPMRDSDENRPVWVYAVDGMHTLTTIYPLFVPVSHNLSTDIQFGEGITLLGYDLQTPELPAGGVVRLATLWQIRQPVDGETVLFTHLQGADGVPLAQADRLDVPSYDWHPGDVFIQLHEFSLPAGLPAGRYPLAVGVYTRPGNTRWPLLVDGLPAGDILPLAELLVTP